MTRRKLLTGGLGALALAGIGGVMAPRLLMADEVIAPTPGETTVDDAKLREKFMSLTDKDWKERLTAEQYRVLRKEGTERAGTSPLNDEKREGTFHCAGCDQALFSSDMKYDSGTGWPSFFTTLPGVFETKRDFVLLLPRTEYHCARCGGHHGHVFKDGPQPTGLRYCNNGVALKFVPKEA